MKQTIRKIILWAIGDILTEVFQRGCNHYFILSTSRPVWVCDKCGIELKKNDYFRLHRDFKKNPHRFKKTYIVKIIKLQSGGTAGTGFQDEVEKAKAAITPPRVLLSDLASVCINRQCEFWIDDIDAQNCDGERNGEPSIVDCKKWNILNSKGE